MRDLPDLPGRSDLGSHPRVVALLEAGAGLHAVVHLAEVTSTNDVALDRLRAGEPPGLAVVGDRQTRGRGRAGRGWEDGPSPEASLMVTVAVLAPTTGVELVPLAAGLAVVDAAGAAGIDLRLKWPNDAIVDDRKCAGTLVERHEVADRDVLLIGIGIDVDWRGHDRSAEAPPGWTSLAEELGEGVERASLLADLLGALTGHLRSAEQRPSELLGAYRHACATLGSEVVATLPGGDLVSGRARDVDERGRLLIDTDHVLVAVTAGDVMHLRPG
jgi:BirA family transcriptional regulator, biotin operon repressor / biotin---[acetyl-CoA-carboxylase] ligase